MTRTASFDEYKAKRITKAIDQGGGGPHDPVMQAQIDRLNHAVERIDSDLTSIKVSIGKIETEMKHVATKTWVLAGALGTVVAILGGVWWIIQQYLGPILQNLAK